MLITKKIFLIFAFFICSILNGGTSGKIDGTVVDKTTKEKLIGVTIFIEGEKKGASSDVDGYFTVLNVLPGTYKIKASMIGYSTITLNNVRVNIDQTTTISIEMQQTVLEGEEVVVVAERKLVQKDVSSSQTNINVSEFENLPVAQTIANVMGLQAGIQVSQISGDLIIRGGGGDQTAVMIDGINLRDERTNRSYLGINLTSVQDIQIQTGGFNAEYGNVRSGIVNVITKEGSASLYSVALVARYSPPVQKYFGEGPSGINSFWIRPYMDDAVSWTGTKNGAWDEFTRNQYPEFEGWNSISNKTLIDSDPNNDLTPEAAQRVFQHQHRKDLNIYNPDYDLDASLGGPIPIISEMAGNLRFFATYRNLKNMYLIPLSRDAYEDNNFQLKLTSDIGPGMKLMVEALVGKSFGTTDNNSGTAGILTSPQSIASLLNRVSYIDARIFANDYWAPTTISRSMLGVKFTNVLNDKSFYEAIIQRFSTKYSTNPGDVRDTSKKYLFGNNYSLDEAPFGFTDGPTTGIDGLRMSVGFSNSRDTSEVDVYTSKLDYVNQINRFNQIKSGVEFVFTDSKINYASVDAYLPSGRSATTWHKYPKRFALYLQDKFEYEGMIANFGLRFDYSHAGGEWYVFDSYSKAFTSAYSLGIDTLLDAEATKKIMTLSPRLGVSFPITENSKFFFNYGHFRSLPTPENLYLIRRYSDNNQVTFVANPNNPFPKTVAYELGYEQTFLDDFLLRLAGYYKDVTNQTAYIAYTNRSSDVNYSVSTPNAYQDIRGLEISLSSYRSQWVSGFVNYTYEVITTGRFGFARSYQSSSDQRSYERTNFENDLYQQKPVPQPYARANIDFFTPNDFGPDFIGIMPLAAWRLSILGNYRAGSFFTWAGGGSTSIPGIKNNVQWRNFYNLDLRFSKLFKFNKYSIEFLMDMSNVLNFKYFNPSGYGFKDGNDFDAYMKSLHLPEGVGDKLLYGNIGGDDMPGDYRNTGIEFTPIISTMSKDAIGNFVNPVVGREKFIHFDQSTKKYFEFINNTWQEADKIKIDKMLSDKSYIDMPNLNYFTFLNPRDIYFGIKINFEL